MEESQVRSLKRSLRLTNPTGNIVPTSTAMLHMPRCHSADQAAWRSTRCVAAAEMLRRGRSSGRGSGESGGHEA